MATAAPLHALIPRALARRLAEQGRAKPSFSAERYAAVALMADVVGFTPMAEHLAASGPEGVERLSRVINDCFGRVVDIVDTYGGDVVRFAGDATIALFTPSCEEPLGDAIARASACARDLHRAIRSAESSEPIVLRIGLGAGEITAIVAGGIDDHWEFVLGGATMIAAGDAQRRARPGDTVLAESAQDIGRSDDRDDARVIGARLAATGSRAPSPIDLSAQLDEDDIRPFVPPFVVRLIDAGQSAWAAELRRVTVLFTTIDGFDLDVPADAIRVHHTLRLLQSSVLEFDGSLVQFLTDDKGLTLVASWGLPGATHEDDAARAVRCALNVRARLASEHIASGIGISTGRVFCGWVGNHQRREYALIGTAMNRAARLMTVASHTPVSDRATYLAAGSACAFESAGELTLKGSAEPVAVFTPTAASRKRALDRTAGALLQRSTIVGRGAELKLLAGALDDLSRGLDTTILISGAAGIGKSTLLSEFLAQAAAARATTCYGLAESGATLQPYLACRSVLARILDLEGADVPADRPAALMQRLGGAPEFAAQTPLVAEVLGLPMRDTALTAQMTEQVRVESTRDVVVRLLNNAAAAAPLVIVIDDAQWLDSLSAGLVLAAHRHVRGLVLVVAARPLERDAATELLTLADSPSARRIDLGPLDGDETRALIRQRLGVSRVPAAVEQTIEAKTGGSPLFVRELVSSLIESGVIRTRGSTCILREGETALFSHDVPESVQGAVAARLDRLAAAEQLALKVASVIGMEFDARTLVDVYPVSSAKAQLDAILRTLEDRSFIKRTTARDSAYAFDHAVIQSVAYHLIPSDQRRVLHGAVAAWLDREAAETPAAVLAHHWASAEDETRALSWLERAGREAARKGAVAETRRLFEQALQLAERCAPEPNETLRTARCLRYVGYARAELGAVREAVDALRRALDMVGGRLPLSPIGLRVRLGREALVQMALLAKLLRAPARLTSSARDRLLEQAEILRLLGKTAFFEQDHFTYATASLMAINVAERTGARETAASAYAALAYIVSMFGLHRLGERWWRLAESSGEFDARLHALSGRMLFLNAHARWDESEALVRAQAQLIEDAGVRSFVPLHHIIRFYLHLHRGEVDAACRSAAAHLDWAVSQNNIQEAFSGHVHLVMGYLEQERAAEVERHIAEAEALLPQIGAPMYRIMFLGLRLQWLLHRQDVAGARRDADQLRNLLDATPAYFGGEMSGYVALTDYHIGLWGRAGEPRDVAVARQAAYRAYRIVKRHAWLNAYARPRRWLLDGRIAAAEQNRRRAHRSWTRALALARRYGMAREAAHAHFELGRHDWLAVAERRAHLAEAREIFSAMGGSHYVDQTDKCVFDLDRLPT